MTRRRRRRRRKQRDDDDTTQRGRHNARRQHHATTKGRGGARATLDETRRAIEHETRDRSSCPTTSPEDVFVAATARSHQDLDAAAQRARCRIGKGIGEGTGEVGMVGGVEGGGEDGRADGGLDVLDAAAARSFERRGPDDNQPRRPARGGSWPRRQGGGRQPVREEGTKRQSAATLGEGEVSQGAWEGGGSWLKRRR